MISAGRLALVAVLVPCCWTYGNVNQDESGTDQHYEVIALASPNDSAERLPEAMITPGEVEGILGDQVLALQFKPRVPGDVEWPGTFWAQGIFELGSRRDLWISVSVVGDPMAATAHLAQFPRRPLAGSEAATLIVDEMKLPSGLVQKQNIYVVSGDRVARLHTMRRASGRHLSADEIDALAQAMVHRLESATTPLEDGLQSFYRQM